MKYVSSITSKYGDVEKVKDDVKALNEILSRQGSSLLIDVIAENAGDTAIRFNLRHIERDNIMQALLTELRESLLERL